MKASTQKMEKIGKAVKTVELVAANVHFAELIDKGVDKSGEYVSAAQIARSSRRKESDEHEPLRVQLPFLGDHDSPDKMAEWAVAACSNMFPYLDWPIPVWGIGGRTIDSWEWRED
jgi:hypothetical protein